MNTMMHKTQDTLPKKKALKTVFNTTYELHEQFSEIQPCLHVLKLLFR